MRPAVLVLKVCDEPKDEVFFSIMCSIKAVKSLSDELEHASSQSYKQAVTWFSQSSQTYDDFTDHDALL